MCLIRISDNFKIPKRKIFYKVFNCDPEGKYLTSLYIQPKRKLYMCKWIKAKKIIFLNGQYDEKYSWRADSPLPGQKYGFQVFGSKKSAIKYKKCLKANEVIKKIEVKDIKQKASSEYGTVYIVDEIYILPEEVR